MKSIFYVFIFFCALKAVAQKTINSPKLKELIVGEQFPNISLGDVIYNTTGKQRFSEFNGKLIILDFWSLNCVSCIENFPKMEKLQQEFGDKIQIFLVNAYETKEQIEKAFNSYHKNLRKFITGKLPIIVNDQLSKLFPGRGEIGYHVWIDGFGIVRLRGISENTCPEKIQELLDGKPITFLKDNAWAYPKGTPLFTLTEGTHKSFLKYNSLIGAFNDDLANPYGSVALDIIDSVACTIRNTYLNQTILRLYSVAVNKKMEGDINVLVGKRVLLLLKDTLSLTDSKPWYNGVHTDKTLKKSRICYEQIVPLNMSEENRLSYMLEDINRYCRITYAIEAQIEKRFLPCNVLIRTSNENKLTTKGGRKYWGFFEENGKKYTRFHNRLISEIFQTLFPVYQESSPIFSVNDILLNETGIIDRVDMTLPYILDMKNIEDLKKALQSYDLDIIKTEREINMLVIKEWQ